MRRADLAEPRSRPPALERELSVLLQRGKAAARAGKKVEAQRAFRSVLEIVPDHTDALLWMAYLAGGGRPSLEYLVRLLEADPSNQRARAAIRWARTHGTNQQATMPVSAPSVHPSKRSRHQNGILAGFLFLTLVLISGLATVAFALDFPVPTPTRAHFAPVVFSATPEFRTILAPAATPTDTPLPIPTVPAAVTPTEVPSPAVLSTLLHPSSRRLTVRPKPSKISPSPTSTVAPISVPTSQPSPVGRAVPTPIPTAHIGDNFRWIDVDLTHQRLVAYEGETPVRTVAVSTGLPRTPTVTGRYRIYVKFEKDDMSGPGYYLRDVPYVMYFYKGYGLHGTYWHQNFGQPMSHGCVNLPTPEAEWVFNWASVGTLVVVHY